MFRQESTNVILTRVYGTDVRLQGDFATIIYGWDNAVGNIGDQKLH